MRPEELLDSTRDLRFLEAAVGLAIARETAAGAKSAYGKKIYPEHQAGCKRLSRIRGPGLDFVAIERAIGG
jgi:hypothetical protein